MGIFDSNQNLNRAAFFCDRPTHVLNAFNFVYHDGLNTKGNADIFIIDRFIGAQALADKLRKTPIFSHVYFVQNSDNTLRRRNHLLVGLRQFFHMETKVQSLLRDEFPHYKLQPDIAASDCIYGMVFTSSWSTLLWHELVGAMPDSCQVYFIDDGFFSYAVSAEMVPEAKTLESRIRKFFKHGQYGFNIKGLFLNRPELCQHHKMPVYPLPALDYEEHYVSYIKQIFDHEDYSHYRYIFLNRFSMKLWA